MRMNETEKKIWSITTTALVVLTVLVAVFLMGSRLIGFQVYTVISGSMEPTYGVGDLLYVKEVDPAEVKIGDPITFVFNEDLVVATHRVVNITTATDSNGASHLYFHTKGDANSVVDSSPVHENNLIGVPQFSIPYLGYVSDFIQHPPGTYIALAGVVILVILAFLPDWIGKKKEDTPAEQPAEEQAGE